MAVAELDASPWTRPRERGRERAIKRDAVLRAAAQLFNEFGYHDTSLAMVAARLQVTKPTLYYYVQNKEEILFECVRLGLELLRAAIADAAASGRQRRRQAQGGDARVRADRHPRLRHVPDPRRRGPARAGGPQGAAPPEGRARPRVPHPDRAGHRRRLARALRPEAGRIHPGRCPQLDRPLVRPERPARRRGRGTRKHRRS